MTSRGLGAIGAGVDESVVERNSLGDGLIIEEVAQLIEPTFEQWPPPAERSAFGCRVESIVPRCAESLEPLLPEWLEEEVVEQDIGGGGRLVLRSRSPSHEESGGEDRSEQHYCSKHCSRHDPFAATAVGRLCGLGVRRHRVERLGLGRLGVVCLVVRHVAQLDTEW